MLILSNIFIIISAAVNNKQNSAILYNRIAILSLIFSNILCYYNQNMDTLTVKLILFNGLFKVDCLSLNFSIFIIIITIVYLWLSSFIKKEETTINETNRIPEKSNLYKIYTKEDHGKSDIEKKNNLITTYKLKEGEKITEYPLIILFCITGSILLISSNDLVSIFLSLELQSYGLYLLCSIHRNSENSIKAGLTYFLLGGLSSCIILLGLGFIYLNTGNTNLDNIYIIKNILDIYNNEPLLNNDYNWNFLQYSLILISVGFLFKISAAPFHFWSPDVYDAIPTIVTTFVAIVAKISLLIFLLDLVYYTSQDLSIISWNNTLLFSSVLSLIIGSVLGIRQYRIKRLYAYSTISHIGFILLALSINTLESTEAFYFYIVQYSLTALNAFIILIAVGYYIKTISLNKEVLFNIKDINNSPIQLISQLKGLSHINVLIAVSFSITLFSFIGVPPLIGFFGKQMILTSAINNDYIFIALIGILTSVISAVYYLFIVKTVFFDKNIYNNTKVVTQSIPSVLSFTISVLTTLILIYMFSGLIPLL